MTDLDINSDRNDFVKQSDDDLPFLTKSGLEELGQKFLIEFQKNLANAILKDFDSNKDVNG